MFHCLLALNVSREISKDSPHFPFSVCSLYFDACRIISFSLKSSTYISICINVHEFSSSSKKDTVCPINVRNWALSENFLKWYVQIFFSIDLFCFLLQGHKEYVESPLSFTPIMYYSVLFFSLFCLFSFYFAHFLKSALHVAIVFLSVSFLFCP